MRGGCGGGGGGGTKCVPLVGISCQRSHGYTTDLELCPGRRKPYFYLSLNLLPHDMMSPIRGVGRKYDVSNDNGFMV